jgi:chaperonin GroES
MTFRPLGTRLLIRPDDPDERSKGGIIIPDAAKVRPAQGTIIATGPGMLMKTGGRWPMPGKPGDKVVYSKFAGQEVKLDGVLHLVVRDDDCLAAGAPEMRPVNDRVLIRPKQAPDKIGSLYIPDTAKEKPLEGEVVAIGNGKIAETGESFPLDVKVGEVVMYGKYAGTEIEVRGEKFLVMREDDIIGVLS